MQDAEDRVASGSQPNNFKVDRAARGQKMYEMYLPTCEKFLNKMKHP